MELMTYLGKRVEAVGGNRVSLNGSGSYRLEWFESEDPDLYQWYLSMALNAPHPAFLFPVDLIPQTKEGFGVLFPEVGDDYPLLEKSVGKGILDRPNMILLDAAMELCQCFHALEESSYNDLSIRDVYFKPESGEMKITIGAEEGWTLEELILLLFYGTEDDDSENEKPMPLRDFAPRGVMTENSSAWFSYLARLKNARRRCPNCKQEFFQEEPDVCPHCGSELGTYIVDADDMSFVLSPSTVFYGGIFPSLTTSKEAFRKFGRASQHPQLCLKNEGGTMWETITPMGRGIMVPPGGSVPLMDGLIVYFYPVDPHGKRERIKLRAIRKGVGAVGSDAAADEAAAKKPRNKKKLIAEIAAVAVIAAAGWVFSTGEIPLVSPGADLAMEVPTVAAGSAEAEGSEHYYRMQLDEAEQAVYDVIETGLQNKTDLVVEDGVSEEDAARIYKAVVMDHPDFYFVDAGKEIETAADEKTGEMTITPGLYEMTEKDCNSVDSTLEELVRQLNTMVGEDADDVHKAQQIYTFLTGICENAEGVYPNSLVSVFVERVTGEQGFARAYAYFCRQLDVPCILVEGTEGDAAHVWNKVYMNGDWYVADLVKGDPTDTVRMESAGLYEAKNLDYFAVNPAYYDTVVTENADFTTPACADNGAALLSADRICVDSFDAKALESTLIFGYKGGVKGTETRAAMRVVCTNEQAYEAAKDQLVTKNGYKSIVKRAQHHKTLAAGSFKADANDELMTVYIYKK